MIQSGRSRGFGAALLISAIGLSGCASTPPPTPGLVGPMAEPQGIAGQYSPVAPQNYILRPGDRLSIGVFREPDLSVGEVLVPVNGTISLPLLGLVQVEGLTPEQVRQTVESQLAARYLNDPSVSVNVVSYGSHRVTVEGAVTRPGVFTFDPGTTLAGALSLAQGPNRTAETEEIIVFRDTPEGMTVALFDLTAMRRGTMIDPVLRPGDRVVVGTSQLSQLWQDALTALPAAAIFTRVF